MLDVSQRLAWNNDFAAARENNLNVPAIDSPRASVLRNSTVPSGNAHQVPKESKVVYGFAFKAMPESRVAFDTNRPGELLLATQPSTDNVLVRQRGR